MHPRHGRGSAGQAASDHRSLERRSVAGRIQTTLAEPAPALWWVRGRASEVTGQIMSDWAAIGVTAVLGVGGLYLGQSVRRKRRAEVEAHVAERRLQAYGDLWQTTITAAPSNGKALTAHERDSLHRAFTKWYFAQGNGMVPFGGHAGDLSHSEEPFGLPC